MSYKVKQDLFSGCVLTLSMFRAGSTVHILDTVDPDWWRGRCTLTGGTGFLPSTYLARVLPGEMIFRVVQPCSLLRYTSKWCSLLRYTCRVVQPTQVHLPGGAAVQPTQVHLPDGTGVPSATITPISVLHH